MRLFALIISFVSLLNTRGAQSAADEIPFEFHEGLLWIKAAVPQSTEFLNLLLDTGAGASVINLTTAQRLGLKPGRKITVRGVDATLLGRWLNNVSLNAGEVALPTSLLAVDISKLSHSCDRPLDGLVGADFFRGRIVQIDFESKTLRMLAVHQDTKSEQSLPLDLRPCGMRVPITVNGQKSQWVRLDTGCASALQWVTATVRPCDCKRQIAIGLTDLSIPQTETAVDLGNQHFPSVPTGLHSTPIFTGEFGLLGNGLLSRFSKVTIDAKSGRLFLEPKHLAR